MTSHDTPPAPLRFDRLDARAPTSFRLVPDAAGCADIAARLKLTALRKLRFEGEVRPEGRGDWRLQARLGATVVQPCVITLAPVTTRIETGVVRLYRADMPETPPGDEVEMPEDDSEEPRPERLDLAAVMEEALALALPLYPRAEGAEMGEAVFAPPGAEPLREAEAKPFAALADLKKKLED